MWLLSVFSTQEIKLIPGNDDDGCDRDAAEQEDAEVWLYI